jgi:hypothetical protein
MQVLRVATESLEGRRNHSATALLIVTGSGAAGAAALATGLHPLVGLLVAVTVASLAAKACRRLRRTTGGTCGETAVAELLSRLPDDYFLLNDLVVRGLGESVDHVVVGPCGVVVIETRRSSSAQGAAAAVCESLRQAHPDLTESALRFVDSIVVCANPTSRVRIDRAQTAVVRYSHLLDVVLAKARRKKVPGPVAARLAATLATCTAGEPVGPGGALEPPRARAGRLGGQSGAARAAATITSSVGN